jgi:3-oxoacyl-[acyl-carrier-protein] synthase-3
VCNDFPQVQTRPNRPKEEAASMSTRVRISSLGLSLPERVLTNADWEKRVATSDEWIRSRTGIRERRVVEPGTPASELALPACRQALEQRGLDPAELELIIVATVTPDMVFPATACLLQEKLGARKAWGFDLSAACSGFPYALATGAQFVASGAHRRVMVVGVDVMSTISDPEDRTTCVLFGDAAGAVLLEPSEDESGILDYLHVVDGWGADLLNMPGGGSLRPASHETVDGRMHFVRQKGGPVFKYATRQMADVPLRLLQRHGYTPEDLALLLPHQANVRIIEAAQARLGLPDEKIVKNIEFYGNTTSPTIPLALGTALDEGRLKDGDLAMMVAVGAGLTVGSVLLRWSAIPWNGTGNRMPERQPS